MSSKNNNDGNDGNNNITNINLNNIDDNDNKNSEDTNKDIKDTINFKTLKILCVTWNIAGIPNKDYNIEELFTNNIFYQEKKSPDIIVIALQEIVELNLTNILLVSNQESVDSWTNNIQSTIKNIFPNEKYNELIKLSLVGIYYILFIKEDLKPDISLLDHNIIKTGMYGTLGNKGFFIICLKYFDKIISFGTGHFEAGQSYNSERVDTLIQLLNNPLNIKKDDDKLLCFKDSDYWIILGDLNFRIELTYENAINLIKEKNYDFLYGMDQLNFTLKNNKFLENTINEKKINFDPTYKYEQESNEYAYDEEKLRVPAWTDRILFCKNNGIKMLSYNSIKTIRYSDHRPVVGTFEIIVYPNKIQDSNKK